MENISLKESIDRLFNVAYKHDIHPVCSGYNNENDSLIVGFNYDFIYRDDDGKEIPSPFEISYSLGATKRKQLKDFLIAEGVDEEDLIDIMKISLVKRSIITLHHTVSSGLYGANEFNPYKEKVRKAAVAFMTEWNEHFVTTSGGKSVMAALVKFNQLEDRLPHTVLNVSIGTQP